MAQVLDILIYPDKRLREVSRPVSLEEIKDPKFQAFLDDMFATMYASHGVGLAAVQVGVLKRVMTLDCEEEEKRGVHPQVLINPEIIKKEGEIIWKEGCLSCPELVVPMKRFASIKVKALDRKGKEISLEGEELLAVGLQHEIDHMDGKLIVDHLSNLKKKMYRDKLKKNQRVVL
ncbi:MAG: peptide deformylase [Deltaproteobacteria bacterium]|nr:peptide deformylase [Deltaproteobacteria bacterium]